MPSFLEAPRFPDVVAGIAMGGPTYSTSVVGLKSGYEQRNQNWAFARGQWDFPSAMQEIGKTNALIAFFRVVKGRAFGFRFRDPMDSVCANSDGSLTRLTSSTYQLYKNYSYGGMADTRKIVKPDAATFALTLNGGANVQNLDSTAGVVTLSPTVDVNVSAVTLTNPALITTAAPHNLVTGQLVDIAAVVGPVAVNGTDLQVTVISATQLSVPVDTSGAPAYVGGGTVKRYAQTLATNVALAITNATVAGNNVTVTTSAQHSLVVGQSVAVAGINGLSGNVNGAFTVTAAPTSTSFTYVSADVTGAYTNGGTASYTRAAADLMAWSGSFDVPCRFDVDELKIGYNSGGLLDWSNVKIVEILQ